MGVNIFPIQMGFDIVYLVKGEGVILIDGGDPQKISKFEAGMKRASIQPADIQLIVLTHGHWDHIGSAKEIQDLTGARILMHQKDVHLVADAPPIQPPGFTPWGKILIALLKRSTQSVRIPFFEVDILVEDEDISLVEYGIPGNVVHTPGHSWGSVSVLLESGEAFVGDLAMNMFPMQLTPGLPIFGDDLLIVKKSWRKLIDMGVKTIYPAHGKPFPADSLYKSLS